MRPAVLVTGGAGFIGSHTCVELLEAGFSVTVLDDLSNSEPAALERVQVITKQPLDFVHGDVRAGRVLDEVFGSRQFQAVVHFAGVKAVGESVAQPLHYYDVNVGGTLALLRAMQRAGVRTFVFSSSATVYAPSNKLPLREDAPRAAYNPYGRTKLVVEDMLRDLHASDTTWRIACLRYFNPVGAHHSGLIGEDPQGIPNNLMPYITQVACGRRDRLAVFGGDYPTRDGTGVRDYIHVVDLAKGHVASLALLLSDHGGAMLTLNLGTGRGVSVLEMVTAFEEATGCRIPYDIVARRPGDIAEYYGDPAEARRVLGWVAERSLSDMCRDAWRWQSMNSLGHASVREASPETT